MIAESVFVAATPMRLISGRLHLMATAERVLRKLCDSITGVKDSRRYVHVLIGSHNLRASRVHHINTICSEWTQYQIDLSGLID
jgi:hypothetical protein